MESQVWVQSFGPSAVILLSVSEGAVGGRAEHACPPKCLLRAVLLPREGRVGEGFEVLGTLCLCDLNPSPRLHQQPHLPNLLSAIDANANRNKCGEAEGEAAGGNPR